MLSGEGGRGRAWHNVSTAGRQAGRWARGRTAGCSPRGLRPGRSGGVVRRAVAGVAPPAGLRPGAGPPWWLPGWLCRGNAAGPVHLLVEGPDGPRASRGHRRASRPDFRVDRTAGTAAVAPAGYRGILHDLLLDGRPGERAALAVLPGAIAAQMAFRTWGWSRVARTRGPQDGSPVLDVLVIALPARHC